jgi:hypothetical protein
MMGMETVTAIMRKRLTLTAVALTMSVLLAGCVGYGGEKVVAGDADGGRIVSDGEHCAIDLPAGWIWYPAKWAAKSPLGTQLSFDEAIYGRPRYPDWDEAKQTTIDDVRKRNPTADIQADDDSIRIDFGPSGGLSLTQRFDRIGCRLTFTNFKDSREQEFGEWGQIIDSLVRTSPTPNFTPEATE